jgi:transposase
MNTAIDIQKASSIVGIDISKLSIDVSIINRSDQRHIKHIKLKNDKSGFISLRKALISEGTSINSKTLIICESMGNYGKPIIDYFANKKTLLCIESPLRIKRSLGLQRGKNDKIDSERIALYALSHLNSLVLYEHPRPEIQFLRHLLRARQRLVNAKSRLKTPLKELSHFDKSTDAKIINNIHKPVLTGIERSLEILEDELGILIKKDAKIKRQVQLLTSIHGIGNIIALHFICYTNEFTRCTTGKELACYVGVAPFKYTSGTSVNSPARVSRMGNKILKSILHMSAVCHITSDTDLNKYFLRKVAEGKHKMSVINAIKNKLILRMVAVIRNDRPYEERLNKKSSSASVRCKTALQK